MLNLYTIFAYLKTSFISFTFAHFFLELYKAYTAHVFLYVKKEDSTFSTNNIYIYSKIDWEATRNFIKQYHDIICDKRNTHICLLNRWKEKNIKIHLNTFGGSAFFCDIICNILMKHKGKTVAYVKDAFSAGAKIALSCDLIEMDKNSRLSPIDGQIKKYLFCGEFVSCLKIVEKPFRMNLLTLLLSGYSAFYFEYIDRNLIKDLIKKHKEINIKLFRELFLNFDVKHTTFYNYNDVKNLGLNIYYS